MQMVIIGNFQLKVFQSVRFPDQSFCQALLCISGFDIKKEENCLHFCCHDHILYFLKGESVQRGCMRGQKSHSM